MPVGKAAESLFKTSIDKNIYLRMDIPLSFSISALAVNKPHEGIWAACGLEAEERVGGGGRGHQHNSIHVYTADALPAETTDSAFPTFAIQRTRGAGGGGVDAFPSGSFLFSRTYVSKGSAPDCWPSLYTLVTETQQYFEASRGKNGWMPDLKDWKMKAMALRSFCWRTSSIAFFFVPGYPRMKSSIPKHYTRKLVLDVHIRTGVPCTPIFFVSNAVFFL